jgi:hypothetical protein
MRWKTQKNLRRIAGRLSVEVTTRRLTEVAEG